MLWRRKAFLLVLSIMAAACGSVDEQQKMDGRARVGVQGFGLASLETVVVSAQPGNATKTLVFDPDTNLYQGELVLASGDYTLTVTGYTAGTSTAAASGEAAITVVGGQTTAATIVLFDQTAQDPRPSINAIVRSVSASSVELAVNTPTTLVVDVINYDNKPVTYSWTSDCPSGVFSAPSSAATTWMSTQAAACTLAVNVISENVDFHTEIPVLVRSGGATDGVVVVGGRYVSRPRIEVLFLSANVGDYSYLSFFRRSFVGTSGANFSDGRAGVTYSLNVQVDRATRYGTLSLEVSDDCGGVFALPEPPFCESGSFGSICNYYYNWTPPSTANTVCKISARAMNDALVDEFAGAILLK